MSENRSIRRTTVSLAVAAALTGGYQSALAQKAPAEDALIEEIVTTATRREASVQDISIAVTALGEDQLKLGGITDISRLEHLVPGMRFGQSGSEARIAMRGTRTNNVGTEAEQTVGIFEDGVYVPTTTQAMGAYVDVSRIEVLRGPQGTLYGRNTFGGTINIITNMPDFDGLGGNISALYGDYDRTRLEGVLNVPLADNFAVRIAAMMDQHDGYIENFNEPGTQDDLSDEDITFFRVSARWAPSDTMDLIYRYTGSDRTTNGNAIWGYQQIGGWVSGQLQPGHQYAPADASADFDRGPWEVSRNLRSNADTESQSHTLTFESDMGPVTFKAVANYTDFEGQQNYDPDYSDGGDSVNNGFTGWDSSQDTSSIELQLTSNSGERLDWLLGYYYYEQSANWNWLEFEGGVPTVPHWDRQGDYKSDSNGLFANATYAITDTTRVVGGIRWQEDTKTEKDLLDWSVFPPVQDVGSARNESWDDILWKIGLEYDINDDMMVYGKVSTGYRAGGFNIIAAGIPSSYDPEEVTAYEIGLKSTLADGTVQLNLSAYHNAYTDMHAQSFIFLGGTSGGVDEFTENGGEVDATGLEVELRWAPGENWDISATGAFMNAEFGTYNVGKVAGLGNQGGRQDLNDPNAPALSLTGWAPALSPDVTVGAQVGYSFDLNNGSILKPFLQTTYTGEYAAHDINVDGVFQDAHTKSDARVIWFSPTGKIEVQAYVLNLEDEAVLNRVVVFNPGGTTDLASLQANWNNPRTWGISARFFFD
jgi:outer membrane receptor protein involved in Fe transport